jgi:HD-like signal output (HDOD) protein/ActR/RegA family two-component response regulator
MVKVLFVDDEPTVLRAIDRLVRVRATPWQARFAGGGVEALAALEREPFDIIVSDMSMPEMDGLTLLGNVRLRFPGITRLALSGQTAISESARAVSVIHRWLAKPCDFRVLCASIEQLSWVRALVADPVVLARTGGASHLPSPPRLYLQVTEALTRGASMPQIVAMIETDPAVVAKLLQLVNSAFFGESERSSSVTRAVALVGAETLRGLLLGAQVFAGGELADRAHHSQFVAQLARELAPRAAAGDAFVAGLLHDVGELLDDAAPAVKARHAHARAGGLLLGMWGIPDEIVSAVAYHHDPDAAPDPGAPVLRAVALAEVLTAELETAAGPGLAIAARAAGAAGTPPALGVSPDELATHRARARALWSSRPSPAAPLAPPR